MLPSDRYQKALFAVFLLVFGGSCINPPYLQFMLMQHAPTLIAAALLVFVSRRSEISRLSYTSIIVFLCLHTIGARYLYTYFPYDAWSEGLLGINITESFGFQRNHYDRMVHFSYGLLLVIPVQEIKWRYLKLSLLVSSILAIEFILATSAAFELIEWMVAVVFTPEWADSFLGQQGDPFDAQKDTALAVLGSIMSMGLLYALRFPNCAVDHDFITSDETK